MGQPTIQETAQTAGELAGALMNMLGQLVDKVLGSQAQTKDGKPLRDVCYMHLPSGLPIDPREYANAWTPAGADTLADANNLGQINAATAQAAAAAANGSTGGSTPADTPEVNRQLAAS